MKDATNKIDELIIKYTYFPYVPEIDLFQYSRAAVLKSIADTNTLWATERFFLNDPTEFEHGMELFFDGLGEFMDTLKLEQENARNVINHYRTLVSKLPIKYFIASFTENLDLLSQWRGYGDSGRGVSIGFVPSKINIQSNRINSYWCKVIYDDSQKLKLVNEIIADFSPAWKVIAKVPDLKTRKELLESLLGAYVRISTLHSLRFKDSAWKEENEWRLVEVIFPELNREIFVREREHELIEYVKIPLDEGFLSTVCVGPRANFENQQKAILTLTKGKIMAIRSKIPWL